MKRIIIILLLLPTIAKSQGTAVDSAGNIISTYFSVGTKATTAPLTVANFATSFISPQAGTMLHIVSDNAVNGRISSDTYNDASFTGPIFQGRRARGTAANPTPPITDDILVAVGADGYGTSSYTGSSIGSFSVRANETFTNTSKATYIGFTTTPTGSIVQAERMQIKSTGQIRFNNYGTGTFTGTPVYALQVDANGNTIEGALGGGASWGGITGTLSSQTDLQTALNGKQATLVSATNIKTINGSTILGSGDLVVSGGGAPTFLNLASNFSNSTTTQTAVTGWNFAVTSGKTYRIEIIGAYQTAALTTGGTIGLYLTSGAGTIRGNIEMDIAQTAVATGLKSPIRTCTTLGAAGSSLTSTAVGVINSPHGVYLVATFTCTTSGTLQVGWASEVAASAAQLNANSTLLYQLLN